MPLDFLCGSSFFKLLVLKLLNVIFGAAASVMLAVSASSVQYFNTTHGQDLAQACERLRFIHENEHLTFPSNDSSIARAKFPCPDKLLIFSSLALISLDVIASAGMLTILFCWAEQLNKNRLFNHIDYVGHVVAGVLMMLSSVFVFIYVAMVFVKEERCSDTLDKWAQEECTDRNEQLYGARLFLIAGGTAFINGILYYLVGLIVQQGPVPGSPPSREPSATTTQVTDDTQMSERTEEQEETETQEDESSTVCSSVI